MYTQSGVHHFHVALQCIEASFNDQHCLFVFLFGERGYNKEKRDNSLSGHLEENVVNVNQSCEIIFSFLGSFNIVL